MFEKKLGTINTRYISQTAYDLPRDKPAMIFDACSLIEVFSHDWSKNEQNKDGRKRRRVKTLLEACNKAGYNCAITEEVLFECTGGGLRFSPEEATVMNRESGGIPCNRKFYQAVSDASHEEPPHVFVIPSSLPQSQFIHDINTVSILLQKRGFYDIAKQFAKVKGQDMGELSIAHLLDTMRAEKYNTSSNKPDIVISEDNVASQSLAVQVNEIGSQSCHLDYKSLLKQLANGGYLQLSDNASFKYVDRSKNSVIETQPTCPIVNESIFDTNNISVNHAGFQ